MHLDRRDADGFVQYKVRTLAKEIEKNPSGWDMSRIRWVVQDVLSFIKTYDEYENASVKSRKERRESERPLSEIFLESDGDEHRWRIECPKIG